MIEKKLYFVFFKNIQSGTLDILSFSGAKLQLFFYICKKKVTFLLKCVCLAGNSGLLRNATLDRIVTFAQNARLVWNGEVDRRL